MTQNEKQLYLKKECFDVIPQVIFLDDEPDAIESFTNHMKKFGLQSYGFSQVNEALEYLRSEKNRTILILSDYRMPQKNGFEFRQLVNEVCPEVPFAILSANIDEEMKTKNEEFKISAFFEKPISEQAFLEFLQTIGEQRLEVIRDELELLRSFTSDATNILEEVESLCLELESCPQNTDYINRIFGMIHTIKGSSGFFDPKDLHQFAHAFEDLLKDVQSGKRVVNAKMISIWLKAVDILKNFVQEFITGKHKTYDVEKLKAMFLALDETSEEVPVKTETAVHDVVIDHSTTKDKIAEVKVSMNLLDEFMQMSGEMTVIRNMIIKSVKSIEKQYRGDKDVAMLSELLEEMHKVNGEVQSKITDIRKVSVSSIVKPLSRTVRDTCQALGKDVEFEVEGSELRIDNSVAEILNKSLIHMVRNSIDHGIESNELRKKNNKSPKGKLTLRFIAKGDLFQIEIEDDGAGINEDKVKEKLLSKQLKTKAQIDMMAPEEIWAMIFDAGFSTATTVTQFSGRGVGMSMVKDSVEEVGGKIIIDSQRGKGSKFTLEIPAPKSVLITNCLYFESCQMTFGVPQNYILKVLDKNQLSQARIQMLEGAEVMEIGDQLLPIFSNSKILGLPSNKEEKTYVILKEKDFCFVLKVEDLFDIEDTVIKPIPFNFIKNLNMYLGGTFLSDATVGLIYDIPSMIKKLELKPRKKSVKQAQVITSSNYIEKSYLSFSIDDNKEIYCLLEQDVERVELMDISQSSKQGNYMTCAYRDGILTLIDLKSQFDKSFGFRSNSDLATVIISRYKDQYVGLKVSAILDLIKSGSDLTVPFRKKMGVQGSFILNGTVMTVIDLKNILENYESSNDSFKLMEENKMAA
jgi:two-component system chemotaxis sensor kinase CheA